MQQVRLRHTVSVCVCVRVFLFAADCLFMLLSRSVTENWTAESGVAVKRRCLGGLAARGAFHRDKRGGTHTELCW